MKILVYTGYDNNNGFDEIGRISSINKFQYANRHSYDFLCRRNYDGYDKPISWFKIKEILSLLEKYDWIFWTDADALIMDMTISIEDLINRKTERSKTLKISPNQKPNDQPIEVPLIQQNGEVNYIISQDDYSPCMGNFLIRSCDWSKKFFEKIYSMSDVFLDDNIWDNRAQDFLLKTDPDLLQHIKFLPKRVLNSFYYELSGETFIMHLPAGSKEVRLKLFENHWKDIRV